MKALHISQFYSIAMLITGIVIRYFINRRRFNRRGIGGLQHFTSYEKAVVTTFVEKAFRWIANVFIAAGILTLVTA